MFQNLMEVLKGGKTGPGAARTRPERAMPDKAYSSRAIHRYLRERGIQCVIPDKEDQKANRKRQGKSGEGPVTDDSEAYRRRNVVECSFNTLKSSRSPATRYDKLALTYRSAVVLQVVVIWSAAIASLGDTPQQFEPVDSAIRTRAMEGTRRLKQVWEQFGKCGKMRVKANTAVAHELSLWC